MIEERARVIAVGEGFAWVETQRQTACGACVARKGCGTATLAKVLGRRRTRLRVLTSIPLRVDDEVIIGIGEHALLRGSFIMYIAPLLSMFLGMLAGETLFPVRGEALTVVLGLLGLAGGFAWLRLFSRDIGTDSRLQPVILRRLVTTDELVADIRSS